MMKNRTRPKQMMFRVTEKEKEMILNNSEKLGFKKFENYARKMLIDGYVINLQSADDKDLKQLMSEVSRIGNNINQIAKGINSNHRVYESDLKEIKNGQDTIIRLVRELVRNTNKIKQS
ncbi:plasmid mobilization relaxosome protein MobC [Turicibacter sanguinis]|uniref:plasmid mobilization protein n=2 Tax=Bacteria TaxID=2 RepID=UPI000FF8A59F|nr:plasmid mobilization relaxosome protein MobC [Bacteroides xylanisolvens]MTH07917.1 plasmid mobilization relaxosome protein MobC [Turicibacter sanguinis]RXD25818.1 plasmid mobilization relaxosome protein MobC [Acinetobacter baumannii]KAB6101775.1 MobC family plasmid mobilization relaxosome protein [Bacteroides xylanisolvens]MTH10874.1 plasmid mobilization relaxosome protein MobC [Turicibacter sanguinis]MTH13655.1 plasmid mobilization relaxosome protein MobC [Turicibacter sanguinis]